MLKNFDNSFLNEKIKTIAGVDEAGRGPLAGPVVAAAAVFDKSKKIVGINDSKKLSEKERNILYDAIISEASSYGIGIMHEGIIEEINILQATLKAMEQAVNQLSLKPDLILIDGNKSFACDIITRTIVKGDSKSFSIAAASILAKVTRDRIMDEAHKKYPQYQWNKNKGYATKDHINLIKIYGPCPLHRKKFLRNIFQNEEQIKLF